MSTEPRPIEYDVRPDAPPDARDGWPEPGDENLSEEPAVEPYDPDADQADVKAGEAAAAKMLGEEVPAYTEEPVRWASPMDAFLSDKAAEIPSTVFEIARENGFRISLKINAIPTPRYNKIIQDHTSWHRQPDGSRVQETRDREIKAALIIESTKDQFDWNDKRLYDRFGGTDRYDLIERMFLRGEIERMGMTIARVSGFGTEDDLEELAGN